MRTLFVVILALCGSVAHAQPPKAISDIALDSLLELEIKNYRTEYGLPSAETNPILKACSDHHSYYMAQSRIVSHYEDMAIRKIRRLYTPKDRIDYYAGDLSLDGNFYSEICMGIRIKSADALRDVADRIFSEIMDTENGPVLADPEMRYFGVSVASRKNVYYVTINVGMGYDNVVALLRQNRD